MKVYNAFFDSFSELQKFTEKEDALIKVINIIINQSTGRYTIFYHQLSDSGKTCKTCRYWGDYREGACDFIDTIHADANMDKRFEVIASADDDTGLDYMLITGRDFGCIHHTTKGK